MGEKQFKNGQEFKVQINGHFSKRNIEMGNKHMKRQVLGALVVWKMHVSGWLMSTAD